MQGELSLMFPCWEQKRLSCRDTVAYFSTSCPSRVAKKGVQATLWACFLAPGKEGQRQKSKLVAQQPGSSPPTSEFSSGKGVVSPTPLSFLGTDPLNSNCLIACPVPYEVLGPSHFHPHFHLVQA